MPTLKNWFLDLLFPRRCLGCKVLVSDDEESHICPTCLASVKMKNDFACAFCGSPVIEGKICPFCKTAHFLDRLFVATSYENPLVEKAIKTMKYRFVRSLADDMAGFMAKYLERRFSLGLNIDRNLTLVVPIPLHRQRLNWRGFNQAEIIGRAIGACLKLNFQDVLKRKRNLTPQAQIGDKQSRIVNMNGAFECTRPESVRGKIVFLVDDVATTGSTLDVGARALKAAGANEVIGFVFAKGNSN